MPGGYIIAIVFFVLTSQTHHSISTSAPLSSDSYSPKNNRSTLPAPDKFPSSAKAPAGSLSSNQTIPTPYQTPENTVLDSPSSVPSVTVTPHSQYCPSAPRVTFPPIAPLPFLCADTSLLDPSINNFPNFFPYLWIFHISTAIILSWTHIDH